MCSSWTHVRTHICIYDGMDAKLNDMKKRYDIDNDVQYYICARSDNGFIAAYRAYFHIQGNKIKKISQFRYEHKVIFGK